VIKEEVGDEGPYETLRESDIRWAHHVRDHEHLSKAIELAEDKSAKALATALSDHQREHEIHINAHAKEHEYTNLAIIKAEGSLDKRLEGMNEFRAQLSSQTATFVTREIFDRYSKEMAEKVDVAFKASNAKQEALTAAQTERHESEMRNLFLQVQTERELRKAFEGSINTWKWIVGFLGASGLAGVIMLFVTGAP
jgi:hypothetical protein